MKKYFVFAIVAMFALASQAQIVSSRSSRITHERGEHHPSIWVDLGLGTFTGDAEDTGLGLDLGFRWTNMFTENIGWDVVKISAQTDTKNFTEALNVQGKTGIRGVTPVLFGNSTLYANFGGGYGYYTDIEEGGFVWEVGAGINVTPRFSVGINYNSANYSYEYGSGRYHQEQDVKVGLLSLRLSYGF